MLADHEAVAMIAVRDLGTAAAFYETVLGLVRLEQPEQEVLTYRSGGTRINVYRSQYAGSNQATALTWNVGSELEQMVRRLRARGVPFEHYALPGLTLDGDVHVGERMKVAWFRDPDGNILSLVGA